MSTLRSATAAANGAKSHGPVTGQGKARSARNAEKHGLYSKALILQHESKEEFDKLRHRLYESHSPVDPTEAALVETMAAAAWRLRRFDYIEGAAVERIFDEGGYHAPSVNTLAKVIGQRSTQLRTYDRAFQLLLRRRKFIKNLRNEPKPFAPGAHGIQ
jgi:hypothetical protein